MRLPGSVRGACDSGTSEKLMGVQRVFLGFWHSKETPFCILKAGSSGDLQGLRITSYDLGLGRALFGW